MKLNRISKIVLPLILIFLALTGNSQSNKPANYVNPFIGTEGLGNLNPGASVPFGMVNIGPDNLINNGSICTGYRSDVDTMIARFTHTHLNGTGCGDFKDIGFMPVNIPVKADTLNSGVTMFDKYAQRFYKENEMASAGYYSVDFKKSELKVELTATEHCGVHRYTFNNSKDITIALDLANTDVSCANETVFGASIQIIDNKTIAGYRFTNGWANNQKVFFYARFDKPFTDAMLSSNGELNNSIKIIEGNCLRAFFIFSETTAEVGLSVGLSAVDVEGARNNLEKEVGAQSFDKIHVLAFNKWNTELDKIQITTDDKSEKTIFYTALFHTFMTPSILSDVDGRYRGADDSIHVATWGKYYGTWSLWDTYRAEHPLFTLVQSERVNDMINSLLSLYQQYGLLPVWNLWSCENYCMVGYPAVPVITEAYLKGFRGFDSKLAYEAIMNSALGKGNCNHKGISIHNQYGYLPFDAEKQVESLNERFVSGWDGISASLEWSYADWCIAQMSEKMGNTDDYKSFMKRSKTHELLADTVTHFIRGKNFDGSWATPFDPTLDQRNTGYCEGNAWIYLWFVPHDIDFFSKFLGGKSGAAEKLDSFYLADNYRQELLFNEINGTIGYGALSNEPSHHIPYLYNYFGQPWKTQKLITLYRTESFKPSRHGLPGNDDCGQTSAWFVFNALGFYPVNGSSLNYEIGTPMFKKAVVKVANNKTIEINAPDVTRYNYYIQGLKINGKPSNSFLLNHNELVKGSVLDFDMDATPSRWSVK